MAGCTTVLDTVRGEKNLIIYLRVAILEQPGLRGQMSSGQNWFDSVINTTQYGGSSDEKILDLSSTVLAQQPFQSSDLGSR